MDKGPGTEFQTISELHLLRRFRLSSVEVARSDVLGENEREKMLQEERFLLMLAVDPEFYSNCQQRATADPSSPQWLEELGFVLALALVLPMQGRGEDGRGGAEGPEGLYERIVTGEKLREMDQTYPEIFMPEPVADMAMIQGFGDLLERSHSKAPLPKDDLGPTDFFSMALALAFPEGYEPEAVREAIARHSALRAMSLADLQQFSTFRKTIGIGLDQLVMTLGDQEGVDLTTAQELIAGRGSMELIYRVSNNGALLRWFRQLGQSDRKGCFEADMELLIEEATVRGSVALAVQLFGNGESTWDRTMSGAEAYRQYGDRDAAVWTYEGLLAFPGLDDRRQALVHNRLAVIHRESGLPRKALTEFLEANILWEGLGERWDEAITAAFIAEGYHQLGKDLQAQRYLESSFRLLDACNDPPERMARGMYFLAGSAHTLGQLRIERVTLQRGLLFAESLEDPGLFLELNDRLLRLPPES